MTDPPQLKVAARSAFTRVLLESALGDHSRPGARERALHGLSLGVGVGSTAAAARASAASSLSSKGGALLTMKWLGFGVLAGATTLLSLDYATRPNTGTPAKPAAPSRREAAPRPVIASQPAPAHTSPVAAEAAPAPPPARPAPVDPWPSSDLLAPAVESADDQLRALQAIRAAIAAQAPERALTLLDAFDRQHRSSSLTEEATVLRIEALAAVDQRAAEALGERFLRQYPHSAYAQRVRAELHLP